MAPALFLIFLVIPLVELYLIIQVGAAIGALNTIALLILVALAGGFLMKREGLGVARRIQSQVRGGHVPARELVDGFLILFGGALLLAPGFLTDLLGLGLLIPPVRAVVRATLARRFQAHIVSRHHPGGRGYLDR